MDTIGNAPALYDWESREFKHEIHMSHLNAFLRCPKQFASKYIYNEERPKPNSVELSTGRVHHVFLKEQIVRKLQHKPLLTGQEINDYVSDEVEEQADFLEDGKETELRKDKDVIIQQALVLQSDYIEHVQPRRTEQKFRISIPKSPYSLVGTIDIERVLDKEEMILQNKDFGVDDLKTSSSSPPRHPKGGYKPRGNDHFMQQTAYSFGAWIANGGAPSDYKQTLNRTVYLVKNKKPVVRNAQFIVTRNDVLFLYNTLIDFVKCLENQVFMANPVGWWCANDKCPIFTQCRKHEVLTLEQIEIANDNW